MGQEVKFLTGTDEHGLKIQRVAEAAGKSPQQFTDEIAPTFAHAWERLDIANDDFIRTTEPRHRRAVLELLQRCYDAGDIELDAYSGKYCVSCEMYYTDDELLEGDLCPVHRTPVEFYEEENYFFRLSRFQDRLLDWYVLHPDAIKPEHRSREALGLIRGGLRDFSVSRTSVSWGIPLPWDPAHVSYVWFDALTNYLSAVGFGDPEQDYTDWWPVDYHLIGKDIIRHHCVYWPAMLMSAGVEPPKGVRRSAAGCSWAARRWRSPAATPSTRSSSPTSSASTGSATTCWPRRRTARTATSRSEGLVAATTPTSPTTSATSSRGVATVVAKKCDAIGPAPRSDSPLAEAASNAYAGAAAAWDVVAPSARSTPRGR